MFDRRKYFEDHKKQYCEYRRKYYKTPAGKKNKKKYYADSKVYHRNWGKEWTEIEMNLLLDFDGSDAELAKVLGRSKISIQIKRSRVKKKCLSQ